MKKNTKSKWEAHHERIDGVPPRPLLIEGLKFISDKKVALDLGAGVLNDSEHLIKEGFNKVIAVDIEPSVANRKHSENIEIIISPFEEFIFRANTFDLITSQWSLPFIHPNSFQDVMKKIHTALKKGGIFTGNLFGDKDGWSNNKKMTFQNKIQAKEIFNDYEIIKFGEEKVDGKISDGSPKHWHKFNFIVKKV